MNGIHHSISRAGRQELFIQAQFPPGTDRIHLPMWRPGRYERGDFGQWVRGMEQWYDGAWQPMQKQDLHVWTCHSAGKDEPAVQVRYRFTARRLDAGSTWADDDLLYVNPVNCLLFHPDLQRLPPKAVSSVSVAGPAGRGAAQGARRAHTQADSHLYPPHHRHQHQHRTAPPPLRHC